MCLMNKLKFALIILLFPLFSAHAALIPFVPPVSGSIDTSDILAIETYDYTSPTETYYYDFYLDVFDYTNTTGQDRLLTFTVTPGANSNLNPWLAIFDGTGTVPTTDHSWAAYLDGVPSHPDFYDVMLDSVSGLGTGIANEMQYLLGTGDSMQFVVTTTEYYQIIENGQHVYGPNDDIFGDYTLTVTYVVSEPSYQVLLFLALFTFSVMNRMPVYIYPNLTTESLKANVLTKNRHLLYF